MKIRSIILFVILGYALYVISINYPGMLSPIIISENCFETKDVFLIIPECQTIAFYIPINSLDEKCRTGLFHQCDLLLASYDANLIFCAEKYIQHTGKGENIVFLFNINNKGDKRTYVSPGKYYISFVYDAVESFQKEDMHVCSFLSPPPLLADIFFSRKKFITWKKELALNDISLEKERHVYVLKKHTSSGPNIHP